MVYGINGGMVVKVLIILLALLLACSLVGCQMVEEPKETGNQGTQTTENTNMQHTVPEAYEPFSITKAGKGYIYRIYNNNVLVEEEYVAVKKPACHYITDTLIHVTVQTGTGKSTNWGFFYDYAANKRSETFQWVLNYTESVVALGRRDKVVIRSIFDDTYYLEITEFEKPLAKVADGILSADFSEDMITVTITYVVDESYDTVTQTFSLTP